VLAVTKERRDALLRSKRLRREPLDSASAGAVADATALVDGASQAVSGPQLLAEVQHSVVALQQEKVIGSQPYLDVLRRLRKLLSTGKGRCESCLSCTFCQAWASILHDAAALSGHLSTWFARFVM